MKKNDVSVFVDPFWGNAGTKSPASEGMARNWNWLKAQTGNTHPGSLLPFGWVSAVPYSGGYSSGYGINGISYCGASPIAYSQKCAWGISHFHTSGTGFLGYFYNYFLITPAIEQADLSKQSALEEEKAHPGYYSGKLTGYGAVIELTAGKYAAFHRYHFSENKAKIRLNVKQLSLGNDLLEQYKKEYIERYSLNCSACGVWNGSVIANGTEIFYAVKFQGNIVAEEAENGVLDVHFNDSHAEVIIAFSLVSLSEAENRLADAVTNGFDFARIHAENEWRKRLNSIRAEFFNDSDKNIFYSALYHSLIKPVDAGCEFTDFQTMWDIYRSQLPLVLAICPDVGKKIAESMLKTIEKLGFFPNTYMMTKDYTHTDNQATSLVIYTLCDAFNRGYIKDYERLKNVFKKEFAKADIYTKSPTHRLDLAGALRAASDIAEKCGDNEYSAQMRRESKIWQSAYDPETGLMCQEAIYYEGTHWNYSFRPHTQMGERIALAGGIDKFNQLLDKFFGVNCPPETQPDERLAIENRFEGMNNESDMETPYCYLWTGRSDRLAEICDLIRRCRFCGGEGGCPGNNDSGGLSSWYIWCVLGIYPYTGTGYYLLGSPSIKQAEIDLHGGLLKIEVERESPDSIYPAAYEFNGKKFIEPWISVEILEQGGTLKFYLQDQPSGFSPIPEWL